MIFETFRKFREEQPGAAAFLVTTGDRSIPISWKQFTDDIAAVAWVIESYAPREKVALLGENSYEWIVAHAACLVSGACVIPLDVNLTAAEIAERLEFTGTRALIHSSLHAEKAAEVAKRLPNLIVGGFGTSRTDVFLERARAAAQERSVWDGPGPRRTEADGSPAIATIVFTSGTTSVPRGAQLTLEALESFAQSAMRVLPLKPGERSLMLLPLHHIFGICATYLMLASGVALGVCPDFRRIYDAVMRFRVHFVFLVPALADILAAKCEQHGTECLRWVLVGGAPMSPRTYERLGRLGIKTLAGYGLTETAALYSISPLEGDSRPGCAGLRSTLPGVETRVSETGELLIRGPNVMKGYYRAPEKTAEVLSPDGWFRTGDLGRIDADGFVWISGRGSRTIVLSSGKKIAPEELEEKILKHAGVHEVVVSGEGESRLVTAEVYSDLPEGKVREIVTSVNRELPVYKRVKRVVVRTAPFPRTSSGKIALSRGPSARPPAPPARRRHPLELARAVPRGWWLALSLLAVVALALVVIAVCFVVHLNNL